MENIEIINNNENIYDRWKIDLDIINSGVKINTSAPQCDKCKYKTAGNLVHCEMYKDTEKPEDVIYIEKECKYFEDKNPMVIDITDSVVDKKLGALFSFAVGDALGVPVEFEPKHVRDIDPVLEMRANGTYNQPFGTWSDDTSLMIAFIEAYNAGYSLQKLADNFVAYYREGKFTPYDVMFDIGNTTVKSIINIERKVPLDQCGGSTEYDNGNGSLMRILPIAFLWDKLGDEKAIELIEEVSAITHGHARSKFACIFYCYFVKLLLELEDKEKALDAAIEYAETKLKDKYGSEFETYNRVLSKEIIKADRANVRGTGYVVHALEASIWSFFNGESIKEVLLNAVNLGDDTDTTAGIAGGIAGAFYGYKNIPDNWIQMLARKEKLADMFMEFIEK